jgi:acyl-[acyl-carrier-protein]-phospholipid O-acyltransferase/long-chain-fatty-acid--[acyl-carrier-protein] ligase
VPQLAVAGRPDPEKGEVLVLLSTFDLSLQELRQKLSAAGIANLWIPKAIRRVKAIPTLATGKLDLKTIQQIARDTDHS